MPPPDLYRATVRYTWNRPSGPHYTSGAGVGLHGANGRAEGARVRTADGEWGGARAREKSSEDRGWRGSRRGASLLRKAVWQLVAERVSEPRDSRDLAAACEACDPTLEEEIRGAALRGPQQGAIPASLQGSRGFGLRLGDRSGLAAGLGPEPPREDS